MTGSIGNCRLAGDASIAPVDWQPRTANHTRRRCDGSGERNDRTRRNTNEVDRTARARSKHGHDRRLTAWNCALSAAGGIIKGRAVTETPGNW